MNVSSENPLDKAAYIFPYYFLPEKIDLTWRGKETQIRPVVNKSMGMWDHGVLETYNEEVLGAVNFWTYFKQLSDKTFYCYARPKDESEAEKYYVNIDLFNTDYLGVIEDSAYKFEKMKEDGLPFLFDSISAKISIPRILGSGTHHLKFPDAYKVIDEILIFSTRDDLYADKPKDAYWSNYVLIMVRPKLEEIEVVSLDWFNKSNSDFGYVWPMTIVRSESDNRLYGRGMRMSDFILDSSGKNIVKDSK